MPAFLLETDARARRASKELKSILSEHDVDLTLRQAQNALARMLGHADWNVLLASVGTGRSPDDAELDEAGLRERHETQESVLRSLGLPGKQAKSVRERLSPTARTEASVAAREVVALPHLYVYHPSRIVESVGRAMAFRHEYARRNGLPRPTDSIDDLMGDISAWVGDSYALTPLDNQALQTDVVDLLLGASNEIHEGRGPLIDVSATSGELAAVPVVDEAYVGAWDDLGRAYVHLGTNAFPSPFPGCGIEGCYVRIDTPERDGLRRIELTFVAGPETVPSRDIREEVTFRDYDRVVYDMRHVMVGIDDGDTGRIERIGDALDSVGEDDLDEAYHGAWRPYLEAPLNAVWNGIRAFRDRTVDVRAGLFVDAGEEQFRRLQRARTEGQVKAAAGRIAEEAGEMTVRFVGGVGPMATETGWTPPQVQGGPIPVDEPHDWARAYLRMAGEASFPDAAIHFADKALAMLARADEGFAWRVERTWAWAHAYKAEALSEKGDFARAAVAGAEVLAKDPDDYLSFRFRLAALHVAAKEPAKAKALVLRLAKGQQPPGLLAWTGALVAVANGSQAERDAALDAAMSACPAVADRLLDRSRPERELWLATDLAGREGEDYVIAGMQRDAWASLPDGHAALVEAVARARRGRDAARKATVGGKRLDYQMLPYSNEEFENSVAGNRTVGYTHMPCEKAEAGSMAMRSGLPVDIASFLDMDPTVASVTPTPCRVRVEVDGRSAHLVPDLKVTTVAGAEWYVLVAMAGQTWAYPAAVEAFAAEGRQLMVVETGAERSPAIRGNGYPQSRAGGTSLSPWLGHAIADAVEAMGGSPTLDEVAARLAADPAVTEAEEVSGYLDQFPGTNRDELFRGWAISKIFRAVREGYVDHDPADGDKGVFATLRPRHAFLDRHDTVATLMPYLASGRPGALRALADEALALVRGSPPPARPAVARDGRWDAVVAAWSPFLAEVAAETRDAGPSRDLFRTELEFERAGDAVGDAPLATYGGTVHTGEPWTATLRRDGARKHRLRVEIGEPQAPRWACYGVEVHDGKPRWGFDDDEPVVQKGPVCLRLTGSDRWVRDEASRGGGRLAQEDSGIVLHALNLVLDQFHGTYAAMLMEECRRSVARTVVSHVEDSRSRLVEAESGAAALRDELDELMGSLPGHMRRLLAGKGVDELAVAKEYALDTVLGVVLVTPQPDGESLSVRPTARRSKMPRMGRVTAYRDGDISVGKDGRIRNAEFHGCSGAAGEEHLRAAVSRFARDTPGAFERAALADCAGDLVEAEGQVRKARARLDANARSLDTAVEEMRGLRHRLSGIPGTEAVTFPDADPSFEREPETAPEPASLW